MANSTIGIFSSRSQAERTIRDLQSAGFDSKSMSVLMKDQGQAQEIANSTGSDVAAGAVSGATTGAVLGGLAGLLIGVGAIAIPGVGPLLVAGPLGAALGLTGAAASTASGAVTGAAAGGLLGALLGLGLPHDVAVLYETRINEGAILVAVPNKDVDGVEVREIMNQNGALQVNVI